MNEFLHENPTTDPLDDLKKRIQELRKKLPKDGDLPLLDLETLTTEDVELWKDYEKFIDLLQSAVEKSDLAELKIAVDYLYDRLKPLKVSLFTSFIANRLTAIKLSYEMISSNKYEQIAPRLWTNIKEQLDFQRKNIISIS